MVGDELELDVVLPKRLGMKTLLLDRDARCGPGVAEPDGLVRDLVEAVNFADSL
jgi:FMN phosphatase YigB (HAD superfamily)